MEKKSKGKIVIVGAGYVGSTTAFSLAASGVPSELVLVDVNKEKAEGEAMDLNHGLVFLSPCKIGSGDYSAVTDADVIIIAAGAGRKPGESRIDLVRKNAEIVKSVIPDLMRYYNGGVFVVISNPVDTLTYIVQKMTGLPAGKVISSGTVLDSARFRYSLSQNYGVDLRNVHGYVLGEHGDSEVYAWSSVNIAGDSVEELNDMVTLDKMAIEEGVRKAGAEIIKRKGATYYGVALSVTRICEAILRNQHSILTVGSLVNGPYGVYDAVLSLPCVVGINGIERIFPIKLTKEEEQKLQRSAAAIRDCIALVSEDPKG